MPVFVEGQRAPRPLWWMTLALAMVVAVTGAVFAYGTQAYAGEHDGRVLPGVRIAGVDLGGMTGPEAVAAVEEAVSDRLDRQVTVHADGRTWTTTPRELGVATNIDRLVDEALESSQQVSAGQLARMRWFGESLTLSDDVGILHRPDAVRAFVDGIAREVNVAAADAEIALLGQELQVTPETDGQVLDTDTTVAAVLDGLEGDGPVDVDAPLAPVAADTRAADFAQVLVLRQSEHTLYLYENGTPTQSWNVAVGESGHPTPTGIYEITKKRHMPTWVNPSPNGWGSGMPARIGPGRGNPLGVRALNWNAPAIRFHGTANVRSIGTNASKGCVRLTNDDVVELYDLIEVGTTIISVA